MFRRNTYLHAAPLRYWMAFLLAGCAVAVSRPAAAAPPAAQPAAQPTPEEARRAQVEKEQDEMRARVKWTNGPARVSLGTRATVDLPAGYQFADQANGRLFIESLGNPSDGSELGVITPRFDQLKNSEDAFFIIFTYGDTGHVKDDDKADLVTDATADAILESIRKATEIQNQERRRRGWDVVTIGGWDQRPFYDNETNNLTFSINVPDKDAPGVNYSSRILGRTGVISANMVVASAGLAKTVPIYRMLIKKVNFQQGQRYSEFRSGDKVAEYGLIGLAAGGATVALAKGGKGLIKLLVAGVAAVIAAISAAVKKIKSFFTGGSSTVQMPPRR